MSRMLLELELGEEGDARRFLSDDESFTLAAELLMRRALCGTMA